MNQSPLTKQWNYRGALVFRQEDGYMTITITVSVAPDEHSHMITYAYNLRVIEEAEHLPGVDLYSFAVTDGTRIQLTIATPRGIEEAWFTLSNTTILALVSPFHLSIVRASESIAPAPDIYSQKCSTVV